MSSTTTPTARELAETQGAFAWWVGAIPIVAVGVAQTLVILLWGTAPWDRQPSYVRWLGSSTQFAHTVYAVLGVLVACVFVADAYLRWRARDEAAAPPTAAELPRQRRRAGLAVGLLSLLMCLAAGRYFSTSAIRNHQWAHPHDVYHYVLSAKHYNELGYFLLYECTVEAAPVEKLPGSMLMRDLRTYEVGRAKSARRELECANLFGQRRWRVFKQDIAHFLEPEILSRERLKSAIHDQGYNGTPLYTFFTSQLLRELPLTRSNVTRLVVLDVWMICGVGVLVCWGFGARIGLLYMLFAFVLAADRHEFIGASFFRYVWLACMVGGIVLAWRRRWGASAGLLTASALLNVFPVLMGAGAFLALAGDAWRRRQITAELRRFTVAGALTLLVLGGLGAAHSRYVGNYAEFREKMVVHLAGSTRFNKGEERGPRLPGLAVSLKVAFARAPGLFRAEKSSVKQLNLDYAALAPWYWLSSIALLGWATVLALRMRPFEAAALFGFVGAYASMTLLGYYYAFASIVLLPLFLPRQGGREVVGASVLRVVFVVGNAIVLVAYAATMNRFTLYHAWLTYTWLVFIVAMLAWYTKVLFARANVEAAPTPGGSRPEAGDAPVEDHAEPDRARA
jgi:hypothetical protein